VQPGRGISCSYQGVRDRRYLFVRHTSLPDLATGQCKPTDVRELYDHVTDPFELENLLPAAPDSPTSALEQRLATLTNQLHVCSGIEGRDPEPESGFYCG
jgi:hypothetical protein